MPRSPVPAHRFARSTPSPEGPPGPVTSRTHHRAARERPQHPRGHTDGNVLASGPRFGPTPKRSHRRPDLDHAAAPTAQATEASWIVPIARPGSRASRSADQRLSWRAASINTGRTPGLLAGSDRGPASSQIGMAIGLQTAGMAGALAAWTAFTLSSASTMVAFSGGLGTLGWAAEPGWIDGLKAAAVVANAVGNGPQSLSPRCVAVRTVRHPTPGAVGGRHLPCGPAGTR